VAGPAARAFTGDYITDSVLPIFKAGQVDLIGDEHMLTSDNRIGAGARPDKEAKTRQALRQSPCKSESKGARMRVDPVRQPLRPRCRGIGVARRAESGDEQLRRHHLATAVAHILWHHSE
jgi:hypothetical protein